MVVAGAVSIHLHAPRFAIVYALICPNQGTRRLCLEHYDVGVPAKVVLLLKRVQPALFIQLIFVIPTSSSRE